MRDEKFAEGNKQKLYSFCLLVILRASDEYPSPNFFFMVVNYHKNCLLSQEPAHSQKCYSCVDQGSSQEFIVKEIISLSKTQTNHQTLQVWWPPVISKNYNHISVSSDSNPHSDPSLAVSLRLLGKKHLLRKKTFFGNIGLRQRVPSGEGLLHHLLLRPCSCGIALHLLP